MPSFLAREDLPPVELPLHCSPHEVVAPREKTAFLSLSLKTKIDQFCLEEEGEAQEEPVKISDLEGELDRSSIVHSPRLIVALVDSSFKEEEEMALTREVEVPREETASSRLSLETEIDQFRLEEERGAKRACEDLKLKG